MFLLNTVDFVSIFYIIHAKNWLKFDIWRNCIKHKVNKTYYDSMHKQNVRSLQTIELFSQNYARTCLY